jgi:molecular chaperone GrpE (heat shock protein)
MSDQRVPSPAKWPFIAADLALLAAAYWIVEHYPHPVPVIAMALAVGCVVVAAFLAVMPFRMHYQALVRFAESNELNDAVAQINKVDAAAEQIRSATAQWQGVQEQSALTVTASREISERIIAEAKAFSEFMQKADGHEKATLRLEVEKLRRSEGQWLQLLVHLLDHVYALRQAGARSGQPNLEAQLSRFGEACYDVVRRVGLIPFDAVPGYAFDVEKHQVVDGQPAPEPGAQIGQTLASGYTFQGQMVRRSLVSIQSAISDAPAAEIQSAAEPAIDESEGGAPASEMSVAIESPQEDIPAETPEVVERPPTKGASDESFRLES